MAGQVHVRRTSMYFSLSPISRRRFEDDSILSHPLVSASQAFPPQLFFNDPSFNPLYSPYLNNALQTNGFQNNGFSHGFHNNNFGRAFPARQPTYNEDFKYGTGYQSTFHGNFREVENPYRSPTAGLSTHNASGFGNFKGAENPYQISNPGRSSGFGNFREAESPYRSPNAGLTLNDSGFGNSKEAENPYRSPAAIPSTHNSSGFGNAAATSPATGMFMGI